MKTIKSLHERASKRERERERERGGREYEYYYGETVRRSWERL